MLPHTSAKLIVELIPSKLKTKKMTSSKLVIELEWGIHGIKLKIGRKIYGLWSVN